MRSGIFGALALAAGAGQGQVPEVGWGESRAEPTGAAVSLPTRQSRCCHQQMSGVTVNTCPFSKASSVTHT